MNGPIYGKKGNPINVEYGRLSEVLGLKNGFHKERIQCNKDRKKYYYYDTKNKLLKIF